MQALPSLRPSRVTAPTVPTAGDSNTNRRRTAIGSTKSPPPRTVPKLKPVIHQRPSKPLVGEKPPKSETVVSAGTSHRAPVLVHLPRPSSTQAPPTAPATYSTDTNARAVPAPPVVVEKQRQVEGRASSTLLPPPPVPAPAPTSADATLERLISLCHKLHSALTPATESVVRLRTPLNALLDDLKAVQRAQESDNARFPSVARLAVVGSSMVDRQALLAFLWYGSTESAEEERDVCCDASAAVADAPCPQPMTSKPRRTHPSSFRSGGTASGAPRTQLGLLPFNTSSASLRFTSPTTSPQTMVLGFAYDQRLLYSPTDTVSVGAFPSSCESSTVYPGGFGGDRNGTSWLLASPHTEIVQLLTPTSPSRSPMSSSLKQPAAPSNPKVRVPSARQALGLKDDAPKVSASLSGSASLLHIVRSDQSGHGALVQRFTAGVHHFSHHQRVLSSDTDVSNTSPPLGPAANPLVDSDDRISDCPIGADNGMRRTHYGRGQSLLVTASTAGGPCEARASTLATNSDGAVWEGLLDMPRSRADTVSTQPSLSGDGHARSPAPCTAHMATAACGTSVETTSTPADGVDAARESASGAYGGGVVRRVGSVRSCPRGRTICVQPGTFDVSAVDLVSKTAASAGAPREGGLPEVSDASPTSGRSIAASPHSSRAGSSGCSLRTSSAHVATPSCVPRTAWFLQEQEQAVVFASTAGSPQSAAIPPQQAQPVRVRHHSGHVDEPSSSASATAHTPPAAPLRFTGDAYLFCIPFNHVGRPVLRTSLQALFGPLAMGDDAAATVSPLTPMPRCSAAGQCKQRSSDALVSTLSAPFPGANATVSGSVFVRPTPMVFPRSSRPISASHGKYSSVSTSSVVEAAEAGATWLRAARQLTASQTFFVITGAEAVAMSANNHTGATCPVGSNHTGTERSLGAAAVDIRVRPRRVPLSEELHSDNDTSVRPPTPPPLTHSTGTLIDLFCKQVHSMYGVVVERWQVIAFSAPDSIAARDFLGAYHNSRSSAEGDAAGGELGRMGIARLPSLAAFNVPVSTHPSPPPTTHNCPMSLRAPRRSLAVAVDDTTHHPSSSSIRGAEGQVPQPDSPVQKTPLQQTTTLSPVTAGAGILKKPGHVSADAASPLPPSVTRRVTSFRGDLFLGDDAGDGTADDLTSERGSSSAGEVYRPESLSLSSTSALATVTSITTPLLGLSSTPPFLTYTPAAIFSADGTRHGVPTAQAALPQWRLSSLPLNIAVNRFCRAVYGADFEAGATASHTPSEELVQMICQHILSDLWSSSGAAQLSKVVKGFEKVSSSHLLSHVAVSLLAWAGQLSGALPEAARRAEVYKDQLQRRLVTHAECRAALEDTIKWHETQLAPSIVVPRMRAALEAAFRGMASAFARDLRVMLILQACPVEMDVSAASGLTAAVAALRKQVSLFYDFYYTGDWESARAKVVTQMRIARDRASSPHSASTASASMAELSKTCVELDRQAIMHLSRLNTAIINVFLQYCAAQLHTLKGTMGEEVRTVQNSYESLLSQLAVIHGAKKRIPVSATRHALRGWRQQPSLLAFPARSRLEPLVTALRASLCEDQVRALARVYKVRGDTQTAVSSAAYTPALGARRAQSHLIVSASLPPAAEAVSPAKVSAVSASTLRPGRATVTAAAMAAAHIAEPIPAAADHAAPAFPAIASHEGSIVTMDACFGGDAWEIATRSRRVLMKSRYSQPVTARSDTCEGVVQEEDGRALALEFSLFGAQSLRRGQLLLGASLRGPASSVATSSIAATSVRRNRRGSSVICGLPPSFLVKMVPEASAPISAPPRSDFMETSVDTRHIGIDSVAKDPTPAQPPSASSSPRLSTVEPTFPERLTAWRRNVRRELQPPASFHAAPLLFLVLETWDELLLSTSMHTWVHYYERDYAEAVNAVASDLLTSQHEWLRRLNGTDDIIREHVRHVDAELERLHGTCGHDSASAIVDDVCSQAETIGNELAAARSLLWPTLMS